MTPAVKTITKAEALKHAAATKKTRRPVSGAPGQEVLVYELEFNRPDYPKAAAVTSTARQPIGGRRPFTLVQAPTQERLQALIRYEASREVLLVLTRTQHQPTQPTRSSAAHPAVQKVRQALGVDPACGDDLDVESVF